MTSACLHEESMFGRCALCGMTWEAQAAEWAGRRDRSRDDQFTAAENAEADSVFAILLALMDGC